MAERIDSIPAPLRLGAIGPLRIRPLAEAPRVAGGDVDARAAARLDSFYFTTPPRTTLPTGPAPAAASRMVAATVPGRVDFFADASDPSASSALALPMYRHPADRNAAATGVNAGRVLDVEV